MKADIKELEEATFAFLQKLIDTMPSSGHKFLAGAMLGSSFGKLRKLFEPFMESDGKVDTAKLHEVVRAGFSSSGNRVTFTVGDDSIKWLLRPVNITIEEQDILDMLASVERRHI